MTKPTNWLFVICFYLPFLLGYFLGGAYVGLVFFTCYIVSFVAAVLFGIVSAELHK